MVYDVKEHDELSKMARKLSVAILTPVSVISIIGNEVNEEIPAGAMEAGVSLGLLLAQKLQRALQSFGRGMPPEDFGIYIVRQSKLNGVNRFYFIGSPADIIRTLKAVKK